nr:hypothetical protein [Anaerolineae bacterium]
MLAKKWYVLTAAVVVGGLLLSACAPREVIKTVEITVPPEEVVVEVTVPPEIIEITPTPGLGAGCTYNAYRMGWVMDYADANNIVNEVFHPDSPFQY